MKLKYILPVATIASVASVVAPLATSCSCGSGINMKYVDKVKEFDTQGFMIENQKIEADKPYTFSINFKDVPNDILEYWSQHRLNLACFDDNIDDLIRVEDGYTVMLNNNQLSEERVYDDVNEMIIITPDENNPYKNTDKFVISVKFQESSDKCTLVFCVNH